MNLPVILSPVANREFLEAAAWYETTTERGETVIEHVQQVLDRIAQMPELRPCIYRDIRRAQVPRFPYNVLYRTLTDRLELIAVFHGKRDPRIWQSRVER
jgi:plasmid stabilization system protein ParE